MEEPPDDPFASIGVWYDLYRYGYVCIYRYVDIDG